MVYEAFVAKKFFLLCAVGCVAVSVLGFFVAGIIPSASTANGGAEPLIGFAWIAAFWGMAAFFVVKARDKEPHLRIDENGLWYPAYSDDVIPWDQFVSCHVSRVYNQRFIGLNLQDSDAYPSTNALTQATAGLNGATVGHLGIAATNLSGGPQGVLAAIGHYRPDLFDEGGRV